MKPAARGRGIEQPACLKGVAEKEEATDNQSCPPGRAVEGTQAAREPQGERQAGNSKAQGDELERSPPASPSLTTIKVLPQTSVTRTSAASAR